MKRRVTMAAVVIAALSVGYAWLSQRTGHAMEQPTSVVATMPSDHAMTAAEHVAMMAAAGDVHAAHALEYFASPPLQAAPVNLKLPADAEGAAARLKSSPRKGEFVKIPVNGKPIVNWVVYPQGAAKAPVVVVIQEVFGLSDWIRGVADQLAAEGFIAVAPDLLTGRGPNGGDTPSFADDMARVAATQAVPPAEVTAMLKAAREWGLKLPQASGKSGSVGFCYGGDQSFRFAVDEPGLNVAVVYYGIAPSDQPPVARGAPPVPYEASERLMNIKAPILGLYGGIGQDLRVGRAVAPTIEKMRALMKMYEPHILDGAAHGFLRAQTGNNGANMRATEQAWPMTIEWLKKYTATTSATS